MLCVEISCDSSCLECMEKSIVCRRCPDFALYTDNYSTCTCPLNSEINVETGNCECIMENAYFKPYGAGCDCVDGLILTPGVDGSLYC